MKFFKHSNGFSNELFVVENLNTYPVRPIKRYCNFIVTNCSVNECWNKLSTYDVAMELLQAFKDVNQVADIGLCSYIAQCLVNPMWEAKMETHTNECDFTMICGFDFELSSGIIVTAEEIWDAISEYLTIINWNETEEYLELKFKINMN